jgi:hypothetical protein
VSGVVFGWVGSHGWGGGESGGCYGRLCGRGEYGRVGWVRAVAGLGDTWGVSILGGEGEFLRGLGQRVFSYVSDDDAAAVLRV